MKINLNNLKLPPDKTKSIFFQKNADPELLESWGGKFKQPVEVDGVLVHDGNNFRVQGSVHTEVELCCSRCLKQVTYTIKASFSALLIEEDLQDEFSQADEDMVSYSNGVADLTPLVEGVIVSEIPMTLLCREGCKGLCAICGKDLNAGTCGCREDDIDPRWEKLKQLT